jgi:hypothetical protein
LKNKIENKENYKNYTLNLKKIFKRKTKNSRLTEGVREWLKSLIRDLAKKSSDGWAMKYNKLIILHKD